jgi:uncharacterized repeat protein (TIGR03803 family)
MLASCAGEGTPPVGSMQAQTHLSSGYTVIHSFGGSSTDGENPQAALVNVGGTLYGTTIAGGSGCYSSGGCGTVFAITTSGEESVLHSFAGAQDGAFPYAGLANVKGTLYGTTGGGASTGGTVYSIETSGTETVLYHFKGTPDGFDPRSRLIGVRGALYGTTLFGGSKTRGTVYKILTSGHETVLYSFLGRKGQENDGKYPDAGLLNVNGTLYGTTYKGGKRDRGTIFKISRSGHETVLHSFVGGEHDGAFPRGGLVDVNGVLYGTTTSGGLEACKGCAVANYFGTIFEITTAGKEKLLYRFQGYPNDGADPQGDLLNVNGALYGVTETGGAACGVTLGCGTIFSVTPSGTETVLHSFVAKGDGSLPLAGLIEVGGTLYGTASSGGLYNSGTVFAFTP